MNCTQCGAPIYKGLKFCTQCGARIVEEEIDGEENQPQQMAEDFVAVQDEEPEAREPEVEAQQEKDPEEEIRRMREARIKKPMVIIKPKEKVEVSQAQIDEMAAKILKSQQSSRQMPADKGYKWQYIGGISGFAETLIALVTNPITSAGELYMRLDRRRTIIYTSFIILISACMTYLSFLALAQRVVKLFYDVFDYFFGYGTVQYLIDEVSLQVLILTLIFSIFSIIGMTAIIMLIYRGILKIDIEWLECVQLFMMPLVIALFSKVVVFIVGLLSIRLALVLGALALLTVAVLTILQFVNRLGVNALSVYSVPLIYMIFEGIRLFTMYQVAKGYL